MYLIRGRPRHCHHPCGRCPCRHYRPCRHCRCCCCCRRAAVAWRRWWGGAAGSGGDGAAGGGGCCGAGSGCGCGWLSRMGDVAWLERPWVLGSLLFTRMCG
jgi:hypothetical protein